MRIGMTVDPAALNVAFVTGGVVVWGGTEAIQGEADIQAATSRLLGRAPRIAWPRPEVRVALGTAYAQTKIIQGLPATASMATIAQIIQTSPGRFFLGATQDTVVARANRLDAGNVECALLNTNAIAAVQRGCRRAGLNATTFAPLIVADRLARERGERSEHEMLRGALGASQLARRTPLSTRMPSVEAHGSGSALITAGLVLCVSILTSAVTPLVIAHRQLSEAEAVLQSASADPSRARTAQREIGDAVRSAARVAAFERARTAKTLLLADITNALPADATLTWLRVDSLGITVTVLSPHAADVARDLAELPGVRNLRLVGGISQAAEAGHDLERITLAFGRVIDDGARTPLAASRDGDADR